MSGSTVTSSLIVSLIDRLTAPARGINAAIGSITDAVSRNALQMDAARGRMLDAVGAGYALAKGLAAPVKAAMAFESAMADVKKVVTFDTPQGFANLGKDIRAMAIRDIPMAADGIAAIVAAAGQSGVAVGELTKFAEMASKVSVAWETGAGETGEALAKLKTALGLSIADVGLLADAINHLGNNTAAAAPDILNFTRRVAPMAKQFGFTTEQAAALGAAMIGSGFEAEVAATTFLNMGRNLTRGASATDRQRKAMKTLGLDAVKVSKAMQKDAVGTLRTVLAQVNKLAPHRRSSIISDIFGDEARALGPLINDAELMGKVLGLVADQTKYAGSAQAEFAERSKTFENSLQLFQNRINDLGISVGNALLPALNSIMGAVGPFVSNISDLAQRFPQATTAIVAATSAIIAFRVAASAAAWSALFMKGSLLQMAAGGLRGVGAVTTATTATVTTLASALGLGAASARRTAREGVASATALLQQRQAAFQSAQAMLALARNGQLAGVNVRQATANLAAAGRATTEAQAGLAAANAAMAATSRSATMAAGAMKVLKVALISTGVGAALVAIGAAGAWIYNNWDGIGIAFEAFKGAFMTAIGPVKPLLDPVISGVSELLGFVNSLLGPVDQMGGGWARAGMEAGKFVGGVIVKITELPGKIRAGAAAMVDAGMALIQSLWDGISAKFNEMLAWVQEIPSRIIAAIGSIDLSSIVRWPSMPSWLGGDGGSGGGGSSASQAKPAIDGARAAGGPVRAGGTYLVGEEGPELFRPDTSGSILPHDVYRNLAGGGAPAAAQTVPARGMGDVTIQISIPGMVVRSETDIDKILAEMERRLRDTMRGLQADTAYAAGF